MHSTFLLKVELMVCLLFFISIMVCLMRAMDCLSNLHLTSKILYIYLINSYFSPIDQLKNKTLTIYSYQLPSLIIIWATIFPFFLLLNCSSVANTILYPEEYPYL